MLHTFIRSLVRAAALVILAAAALAPLAQAELLGSSTSASGLELTIDSELSTVPLNRIHSWRLSLTDASGKPVTAAHVEVRGGMPEHDHGLPTAPIVAAVDEPGRFLLQGIRFHMPGSWRLFFTIEHDGLSEVIEFELEL